MTKKVTQRNPPHLPCDYTYRDVVALQELSKGTATEEQQIQALKWIVYSAAGTYEELYHSEAEGCSSHDTAFACGRAYVGRHIAKLTNMPAKAMEALRKEEHARGRSSNTEQP